MEIDGQLNLFDLLDTNKNTPCKFSEHICNRENLWDVAISLGIKCEKVCCRKCKVRKQCGAMCNGASINKMRKTPVFYTFPCGDFIGKCPDCKSRVWWNGYWENANHDHLDEAVCWLCGADFYKDAEPPERLPVVSGLDYKPINYEKYGIIYRKWSDKKAQMQAIEEEQEKRWDKIMKERGWA